MDYVKPGEVLASMLEAGQTKAEMSWSRQLIRGLVAGLILACATTLAYTAAGQTGIPLVGALLFPVGFVMIVLLGQDLVTGNFALIPMAALERRTTTAKMLGNFFWVIVGHLIGCAAYAALYSLTISKMGNDMSNPLIQTVISAAEAKTTAYKAMGGDGWTLAFIKAILCNWMVTLGVLLSMTSKSTAGKIMAMWLPILTFFAQGFEHTVVNFFVIPAGMMLGANVSFGDWWIWNGIPVLLGNFVGGVLLTGLLFYFSQQRLRDGRKAYEASRTAARAAAPAGMAPAKTGTEA
ncbi:formate/nitrite transporter family protein [Paenibacillus glufosinatiresistens]|uniref:formate/nitrite transporter family protein n=1 Tax=Paenibacillus glufosinatiresistens TaxID=3070657 RepID=UPI00286E4E58|nr:formate/nitrite transporter family protein [Paenibacillus sp. YX.27]